MLPETFLTDLDILKTKAQILGKLAHDSGYSCIIEQSENLKKLLENAPPKVKLNLTATLAIKSAWTNGWIKANQENGFIPKEWRK